MSILRTYFNKDAVIVKDSCVNTGRNPIAELFHGGSTDFNKLTYSRYIFNLDLTDLQNKIQTKEYGLSGLTHKINITNTSQFDEEHYCKTVLASCGEVKRATAFDLMLFEVPEFWDEGDGYDYVNSTALTCEGGDQVYCEGAVNWSERSSNVCWSHNGVYSDPTAWYSGTSSCCTTTGNTGTTINLIKGSQHFDHGDENVCIDVTDYVNGLLLSGKTSCSLGLAYEYGFEQTLQDDTSYVGFFTRDTQTVYEPFMESVYDDLIKDDRCNFYLNKTNRLYLFVNAGGERVNASFSGVTLYDYEDNIYQEYPASAIQQVTTGVYYVDAFVGSSGYCGNLQFTDVWSGITINGTSVGDAELNFITKELEDYYSIGSNDKSGLGVGNSKNISIYDYHFTFSGIKRKEKIKRGDTRRLDIKACIPYTTNYKPIDKIYYRIYIKEGETQIEYIDWEEVNRTEDSNYTLIDTSWFIPNDYYIEFKLESNNQVRTYHDIIQFEIVSEKDWCVRGLK